MSAMGGSERDQELELDLRQLWQALMRRKWIILLLFVVSTMTAYFVSDAMTPVYEASTTVLVKGKDSAFQLPFLDGMTAPGQAQLQKAVEIFKSRTIAWETAQQLGYDWDVYSEEFKEFRGRISVQPGSGVDVIRLSVQHEDPAEAQRIANALVETFIESTQLMNAEDVRAARLFIEEQLVQFEAELELAEDELVRYKEQAQIVAPTGETAAVLDSLTRLETMLAEAKVTMETAQQRLDALQGELAPEKRDVTSAAVVAADPIVSRLRSDLANLEGQLAAALESRTERHPQVVSLKAQIGQLQEQLDQHIARLQLSDAQTQISQEEISLRAEIMAQSARIEALEALIAEREAMLGDLPEKELRLTRLMRNASVSEAIYTMLRQRYEEMRISEAMETASITVLDPALAPQLPVKPRTKLNVAIAGFLGLFVGVGIAFLLEYFDTSFKEPSEIEKHLGIPLLGRTPLYKEES